MPSLSNLEFLVAAKKKKIIRADAEFLRSVRIMDYSLFLSAHDSSEPFDRKKLMMQSDPTAL